MILEIIILPQKHGLRLNVQVSANDNTYLIYHTALGQMIYEAGTHNLLASSANTIYAWEKSVIKNALHQIHNIYPVDHPQSRQGKIKVFTKSTSL